MWSKELRDYTARHFGDIGIMLLKKDTLDVFAAGYDGGIYLTEHIASLIPAKERNKRLILASYDGKRFIYVYETIEELIEDGWAID